MKDNKVVALLDTPSSALRATSPSRGEVNNVWGFTLIELLVVVLIIGILAAVVVPQYQVAVEKARATEAILLVKQVNNALNVKCLEAGCDSYGYYSVPLDELDIELPCTVDAQGRCKTKNFTYSNNWGCAQIVAEKRTAPYYTIWTGTGCGHKEGEMFCYPGTNDAGEDGNGLKICRSLNMLEPTDDYYAPF